MALALAAILSAEATQPQASTPRDASDADSVAARHSRERIPTTTVTLWNNRGYLHWTALELGAADQSSQWTMVGELTIRGRSPIREGRWAPDHRLMAYRDGDSISVLICSLDARPIARAPVDLYQVRSRAGLISQVATLTTNPDGRAAISISPYSLDGTREDPLTRAQWLLVSRVKGEFDLAAFPASEFEPKRAALWTDRPAYQPGAVVNFQVLLLRGPPHVMVPFDRQQIAIQATFPRPIQRGYARWETTLTTGRFGTAAGSFLLPADAIGNKFQLDAAPVGEWQGWRAQISPQIRALFPPDIELSARARNREVLAGDTLDVEVTARTPSGRPIAHGSISYTVDRVEMYRRFRDLNGVIAQGWYGPDPAPITVRASRDESERLLALHADLDARGQATLRIPTPLPSAVQSHSGRLDGLVLRVTAGDGTGSTRTVVLEVPVFPGRAYCARAAEGFALYQQISPDETTVPILRVDNTNRPAPGPIFFRWVQAANDSSISEGQVATRGNAVAHLARPPSGTKLVLDVWADPEARAVTRINASTPENAPPAPPEGVASTLGQPWLAVDRLQYLPGDQARVTLSPAICSAPGILWLEEGWKARPLKLLPAGADSIVVIPIADQHIPSVFVTWTPPRKAEGDDYWRDRMKALDRIVVDPSSRLLSVEVTPDRTSYAPGDSIVVRLKATDHRGRPVAAMFALQAVDEAAYALDPDPFDLAQSFYRLASADNGSITSCGAPPDPPSLPLHAASVPTAFWIPEVETFSATGKAIARAKLPADIARWRITARAVDDQGRLGQVRTHVRTTRSLALRPALPRFARVGDRFNTDLWVDNSQPRNAKAQVSWQTKHGALAIRPLRRHVEGLPRGSTPITFQVEGMHAVDDTLILALESGSTHYEVQQPLTVLDVPTGKTREEPIDVTLSSILGALQTRLVDQNRGGFPSWTRETLRFHLAMADGYALLAQQGLWDGFVPEPSREDDACGDPIRGAIWSLSRQGVDERSVISTAHLIVDWEAGKDRGWRIGEQRDQEPLLDWLQAQAANPELAPDLRVRAAHALMSAGLDTGEAIERCWAARDSLGPEGSALLAVCLASKRPRDSALLLERAVSMTDLDPDSSFATFYSWEKNRPERWGRILAGAEVLEALAMLRPEHPMAAPLANSLILQCSAQRWVQNALIGDALAAIVAYAAAGGPYAISASKAGTDGITNPNSIPSDLIARLPQGALQLTRSFALRSSSTQRPVAGTSREPTFTWDGLDIGSAGDQVGFHCQVGDTLEITLSLVSPIALTDISINDPLAACCGTIPPPLFGWGRGRQMQETWEESAVVLALPQVQTGETELTHRLVADRPGEFQVPPAQATLMSFPEVVAFSEPMVLLIAPR